MLHVLNCGTIGADLYNLQIHEFKSTVNFILMGRVVQEKDNESTKRKEKTKGKAN